MACHVGATGPARMAVRRLHSAPELQLSTQSNVQVQS